MNKDGSALNEPLEPIFATKGPLGASRPVWCVISPKTSMQLDARTKTHHVPTAFFSTRTHADSATSHGALLVDRSTPSGSWIGQWGRRTTRAPSADCELAAWRGIGNTVVHTVLAVSSARVSKR